MSARQFWDQRFAGETFKYGLEPNAFLRAEATRRIISKICCMEGDLPTRRSRRKRPCSASRSRPAFGIVKSGLPPVTNSART